MHISAFQGLKPFSILAVVALAPELSRQRPWRFVPRRHSHNVALMLAAEVGIAGGLLWVSLTGTAAWRLSRSRPTAWLVAGVAAFAALQSIGLLDCYPWSLNAGRLLTVTVLAIIETAAHRARAG